MTQAAEPPHANDTGLGATAHYRWLDTHWLGDACSLTYVDGRSLAEVAATFSVDISSAAGAPVSHTPEETAWLRSLDDWVVVVEPGQRDRHHEPMVQALSGNGQAVHLRWNARRGNNFWHAVAGRMRSGDGLRGTERRSASGLVKLAEQVTGVALTQAALAGGWLAAPQY